MAWLRYQQIIAFLIGAKNEPNCCINDCIPKFLDSKKEKWHETEILQRLMILHNSVCRLQSAKAIPEKLVTLSYVKKCREIYHINLIIRKKVSVLYNTDTLRSILALYVLLNLLMPLFQPPDATFSIFQECQSCESEVLVWVSPNHSSSTRDLEKPILALPLHRIGPLLTLYNV